MLSLIDLDFRREIKYDFCFLCVDSLMVVKQERSVESIRESLGRLERFFSEDEVHEIDRKTLLSMEHDLIRMESLLQMFSSYRKKKEAECCVS